MHAILLSYLVIVVFSTKSTRTTLLLVALENTQNVKTIEVNGKVSNIILNRSNEVMLFSGNRFLVLPCCVYVCVWVMYQLVQDFCFIFKRFDEKKWRGKYCYDYAVSLTTDKLVWIVQNSLLLTYFFSKL
jgi:hypothetical protein